MSNKATESDRLKWQVHRAFLALEKAIREDEKDEEKEKEEFYACFRKRSHNLY